MVTTEKWHTLEPTRIDIPSLKHRMIHIAHTRIDIRLGIYLEQMREDELSSSEVYEPVGDDGDAVRLH